MDVAELDFVFNIVLFSIFKFSIDVEPAQKKDKIVSEWV